MAAAGAWWGWGRSAAPANSGSVRSARHGGAPLLGSPDDPSFTDHRRGALLAVEQHNQDAERTLDLALRTANDAGTAMGTAAAATRLAADPDVSVVIAAGATVPAALAPCTKGRLTLLVTRADTEALDVVNATSALVLRTTQTVGPSTALICLNRVATPARTVIVHGLAMETESLATVRITTGYGKLDGESSVEGVAADENFTGAARRIAARALRDPGHRAARVAGEHVLGAPFLAVGEGWRIGESYTDASADTRTKAFAAAFRAHHRHAPGPWAIEAYGAVRFTPTASPPSATTAAPPCVRNSCAAPGRASPASWASTPPLSTSSRATTAEGSCTG
ncbi:hypothetical protein AB0I51_22780 [Streptomyces sp. NPDC050549]|uniref:hypothetical protein n=1 Tax=Streptomyces sp. NPDC050549 TaxID=3155406 RepID=UPI0034242508